MSITRAITEDDVDEVTAFAVNALQGVMGDVPLRIEVRKIREAVSFFANNDGRHFQKAVFSDDNRGCIAAAAMYVTELPFFERQEGHVYFAFSAVPGASLPLVRDMMRYVRREIRIRRVTWMFNERTWGDRADAMRLAERLGFRTHVDGLVYYKE